MGLRIGAKLPLLSQEELESNAEKGKILKSILTNNDIDGIII